MIVLNSQSSERLPTVHDELVNAFPMDDGLKCLIANPRYARVLMIKAKGSRLYDYFSKVGAMLTMLVIDPINEPINVELGKYNLLAIDLEGEDISKEIMGKFATIAREKRISIIVNCATTMDTYVHGGHKVKCAYFITEKEINGMLSSAMLHNTATNIEYTDNYIRVNNNAYVDFSLDTRLKMFSLTLELTASPKPITGEGSIISVYTGLTSLLSVVYNFEDRELSCFIGKTKHNLGVIDLGLFRRITIVSDGLELLIYVDDKKLSAIDISKSNVKGTNIIIGKNIKVSSESVMDMLVKNFAIYGKALSKKEVTVLSKGRFIMI